MRRVLFVIGLLVFIVSAGCRLFQIKAEDEGPIIVKNGTMTVDTKDDTGEWNDDGDWSHDTNGKIHGGKLWVLVIYKNASFCPAVSSQPVPKEGDKVDVNYSDGNFKAKFKVVGNNPPRTKVAKNDLVKKTDQRLQHGQDGDGGFITSVDIDNQPLDCQITKDNLDQIKICSSKTKCEDATPIR